MDKFSSKPRRTRNEFSSSNEETASKVENEISSKKIIVEKRQEESVVVNQSRISGEIRTLKRRHILNSPQIVITCPADDLPRNAVCADCSTGPTCCVDKAEKQDQKVTSDEQAEELRVFNELSNSDEDGQQNKLWCCDCGTPISSNSDYSTCSSDDEKDTIILSGNGYSGLTRFTSVDNLSGDFAAANTKSQSISDANQYSSDEQSEGSVQNSETCSSSNSESDEDDEEVIIVKINDELKNVVNNHIRSRRNSNASSTDSDSNESPSERCGSSNEAPTSKESEILQRFLEQVETHPQEEDLDVILEIVGEEEDEPCNRSRVNIRECTQKFKEIYAKKLKEIYHNKYRSEQINLYDANSKIRNMKSETSEIKNNTECCDKVNTSGNEKNLKTKSGINTRNSIMNKNEFIKTERTMIDKLPEIRQFHPNNIDHKIPFEERSYLKATSLINEIESCFMETAFLVEKSIGSDASSPYVLKNERDNVHCDLLTNIDGLPAIENTSKNEHHNNKTGAVGQEKICLDSSNETCSYELANTGRIVNEFQTIWDSKFGNNETHGGSQAIETRSWERKSKMRESESLTPATCMDRSENVRDDKEDMKYFHLANSGKKRQTSDHVPRTLEESIDIFEMILEDRRTEYRKPYNAELSSSTLVLNSSRFLAAEKLKENSLKFNSSDNILDDTDELKHLSWISVRNSNTCASALFLQNFHATEDEEEVFEPPKYKSSYDLRFRDHLTNNREVTSNKDSAIRSNQKYRNTYRKYDTYDSYTDDESYITTKRRHHFDDCHSPNSKRKENHKRNTKTNSYYDSYEPQSPSTLQAASESIYQRGKYDINPVKTRGLSYPETSNDKKETVDETDIHVKIAAWRKQSFSKWKSEPDFGKFSYPLFGFQSSSNEEYFDKDYTATSLTTSFIKTDEKMNQSFMKENAMAQKTPDYNFKENSLDYNSRAETIQILSEQPLFSQVDDLLKDLLESRTESSTSDYDEGVVSDQSDLSDQNEGTQQNEECYSASQILAAINGTDGDTELENNIIQIVRGINSISEKHLGQRIEEELEKFMKPKIETICENLDSNIRTSVGDIEKSNEAVTEKMSSLQFHDYANINGKLTEEIKRISAIPEISDIMSSLKHDSPKANRKSTFVHELTAMEQISQASNELRSLGLHGLKNSQIESDLTKLPRELKSIVRPSRKTIHERRSTSREVQQPFSNINDKKLEKSARSLSCFSYFEDHDSGAASDCSVQKPGDAENTTVISTEGGSGCFPGRNSFILKMLHENLRCYVITLAFLEKLLTDDEAKIDADSVYMSEDLNKSTTYTNLGVGDSLHGTIDSFDPMVLSPYSCETTQSACRPSNSKVCSPCDLGHKAFLHGLQRKHRLETLPS